ncbi:MAG: N-acetylmannosamine-6-phosphate 2-epimerase [Blastocatellia bacterium]|nr:N-acetylmannosamine-6-phosphate 2-epimerase [Blastocatellia bacterium]
MQIEQLRGGLIVSCQAPIGSPLNDPHILSAMALTAEQQGAVGVRLNGPANIAAARARVAVPIIGLEKVVTPDSDVYITPTFAVAENIVTSGADIIALDATQRTRPNQEKIEALIARIQKEFSRPVMADIATFDEGLLAADCGANLIATTLCGYTKESEGVRLPAFDLLERLATRIKLPIICEGGVASPENLHRAFDCGAFAVVVGTAITGITQLVKNFVAATPHGSF